MPTLSGTLPRHHPVMSMGGLSMMPHASYIGGPSTLLGHPTLRRQSSHDMEQSLPKILTRNAANVQFYYGWQTPPAVLSPVISAGLPQLPSAQPSSSSSSSTTTTATTVSHSRPKSLTATSIQPLTISTTDSSAMANSSGGDSSSTGLSGDSGGNRTICF